MTHSPDTLAQARRVAADVTDRRVMERFGGEGAREYHFDAPGLFAGRIRSLWWTPSDLAFAKEIEAIWLSRAGGPHRMRGRELVMPWKPMEAPALTPR